MLYLVSVDANVPTNVWIFREPREISCPVEFTEKPVSVIAPVVVLLLMVLNPPSDLIGPLKVVLPMSISLSWQMSATSCDCQGYYNNTKLLLHKNKGRFYSPFKVGRKNMKPRLQVTRTHI